MSDKEDMTRIEDLAEFEHEEGSESNDQFDSTDIIHPSSGPEELEEQTGTNFQFEEEDDFPPAKDLSFNENEQQDDSSDDFEIVTPTEMNSFDTEPEASIDEGEGDDNYLEPNTVETFSLDEGDQETPPEFEDGPEAQFSEENQEESEDDFSLEEDPEIEQDNPTEETLEFSIEQEESQTPSISHESPPRRDPSAEKTEIPSSYLETPQASIVKPTSNEFQSSQTSHTKDLEEIKDFANRITYGNVAYGGNPPFSLVLTNIRYVEDAEDIKIILSEHGLINKENEQIIEQGLERGSVLLSQIGEYSAIYLAHRLRRFDLNIQMGLSDEIHQSNQYDNEDQRGLVNKNYFSQNIDIAMDIENNPIDIESIILSSTSTLENYEISRYIEIISDHTILDEHDLNRIKVITTANQPDEPDFIKELNKEISELRNDLIPAESQLKFGLDDLYKELSENLRMKAFKLKANAVVGINYQITPMVTPTETGPTVSYKISCTGNAVWVHGV